MHMHAHTHAHTTQHACSLHHPQALLQSLILSEPSMPNTTLFIKAQGKEKGQSNQAGSKGEEGLGKEKQTQIQG